MHNLPWLITAYLLASTAVMPLYGKIADIHGRRFTLRIAILDLYGRLARLRAGAEHAGADPRAASCMASAAAGSSSMGMVVLGDVAAPKERGRYYGYFAATYTTAGACGPALGGFIADYLHWSVDLLDQHSARASRRSRSRQPCCAGCRATSGRIGSTSSAPC